MRAVGAWCRPWPREPMKTNLLAVLFVLCLAAMAAAQDGGDEKIVRIQQLLDTPITTRDLPETMPLDRFLAAVEGQWLKEKKVTLPLDEAAFGKNVSAVADAQVKCPRVKNVSLYTVLRRALASANVPGVELEVGVRPDGIVVTRPQRSAHLMVYDFRDITEHLPRLLPMLEPAPAKPGPRANQD